MVDYRIPSTLSLADVAVLRKAAATKDTAGFLQGIVSADNLKKIVKNLALHFIELEATNASEIGKKMLDLAPISAICDEDKDILSQIMDEFTHR